MILITNRYPSIICLMDIMRKGHIAWSATQVWERLWVGGLTDAEELAGGNPHRITTVVSLSEIPIEARRASIAYLHFAIEDDKPVSVRQFDRILDALSENLRWGASAPQLQCRCEPRPEHSSGVHGCGRVQEH